MQLTKEQRRALNTEQKRQQRAREGQLVAPTQQFMAELARYDLPLVQLLMAEYALKPANAGAPGRMRLHFLEQYAATCHTKHAEPAASAQVLDVLAAVLRAHKPARDLLEQRLVATIAFTAQSYSGAHRLGAIAIQDGESLMQLRQRIHGQQCRSGATAKSAVGSGDYMHSLRASKVNGTFTLERRHQAHVHRHFSSAGAILSYDNARETAISGVPP